MSGTAANTALWTGADVFIAPTGSTAPTDTDTAWDAAWEAVGLLNGEEGVVQSRDEDTGEHYAWGGLLFKRTRSKHKRTIKFVALEDNDVVFALVNPGSTRTTAAGLRTSAIKVPTTESFMIGFEFNDGTRKKRRYAVTAEVQEVGEIKESETDPTVYEITVVIFPESDSTLFHEIEDDPAA